MQEQCQGEHCQAKPIKIGIFNTMCITTLACATLIAAMWLTAHDSEVVITIFSVCFGFFSGAAISLTPVGVGQVCNIEDLGKRNGTAFFIASFGTLIGVPLAAMVLEARDGSYAGLIEFGGGLYIAAFTEYSLLHGEVRNWRLEVVRMLVAGCVIEIIYSRACLHIK